MIATLSVRVCLSVLSVVSHRLIRVHSWLKPMRLRRRKTDLDPRIWFLRIHDHGLVWLHINELVIDLFYGFQGKFLIFSHFEFPATTPRINESGHGLRRGGDFALDQRDLHVGLLMFEE